MKKLFLASVLAVLSPSLWAVSLEQSASTMQEALRHQSDYAYHQADVVVEPEVQEDVLVVLNPIAQRLAFFTNHSHLVSHQASNYFRQRYEGYTVTPETDWSLRSLPSLYAFEAYGLENFLPVLSPWSFSWVDVDMSRDYIHLNLRNSYQIQRAVLKFS